MKKNLFVCSVILLLVCSMVVPAFASSDTVVPFDVVNEFVSPNYISADGESMQDGEYSGKLYIGYITENYLDPGTYYVLGNSPIGNFPAGAVNVLLLMQTDSGVSVGTYSFGESFEIPQGVLAGVVVQSQYSRPVLYSDDNNSGSATPGGDGLYYEAFELFKGFIFGSNELQSYELAICSGFATLSVVLLALAPFVLVYWLIRMIGRW